MYKVGGLLILVLFVVPNSVFSCKDGERFKSPYSCLEYDECVNGIRLRKKCEVGKFFDGKTCEYMWKVNCVTESCEEGKTYVRGSKCSPEYDYCFLRKIIKKICPKEQLFNGMECVSADLCKTDDNQMQEKQNDEKEINTIRILKSSGGLAECTNGEVTSYPTDCTMYQQCEDSVWKLKSCNWLQHFDSISNQCQYYKYTCASNKEECTEEGATRDVYARCSEYEQCENKHWENKKCNKGTYFQNESCQDKICPLLPVIHDCKSFRLPGSNKPLPCPEKELFDNEERQCVPFQDAKCFDGNCIDGEKTYVASDCSKYKECTNGNWTEQNCPWLKYYDVNTNACVYYGYTCGGKDEISTTTTESLQTSTVQQKCEENENRAVPGDCKRYQTCSQGTWIDHRCYIWGKFDAVSNECYYFMMWKVNCAY